MAYVNTYEYRRLKDQDAVNQSKVNAAKAERDKAQANTINRINDILKQRDLNAGIYSDVLAQINALNRKWEKEFENQIIEFGKEVGRMQVEYSRRINQANQEINLLRADQAILRRNLQSVENELNHLMTDMANTQKEKDKRARLLLNQLELLLSKIKLLHPEVFEPTNLDTLVTNLEKVRANIRNGDFDAAIGVSQMNITLANQTYLRLVLINRTFNELADIVSGKLETLSARLYAAQHSEEDSDIPYWSNGVFDHINQEFLAVRDSVERALREYDINTLQESEVIIDNLLEQLDYCIRFSLGEKHRSECVLSTARAVALAMESCNYSFLSDESDFVDGDDKKPYELRFESGYGTKVDFLVYSPDKSENDTSINIVFESEEDNDVLSDAMENNISYRMQLERIEAKPGKAKETLSIEEGLEDSESSRKVRRDDLLNTMKEKQEEDLKDVNKLGA